MKIFLNEKWYLILFCVIISCKSNHLNTLKQNNVIELFPAELIKSEKIKISGNPKIEDCKFGKALRFDGEGDGVFIDEMPLAGLNDFTVEMFFYPDFDSPFEQRILHIGQETGNRMLLEIRAVGSNWYFDGFVASNNYKKALIDEKLIHPLGQWYHVAFVVCPSGLTTFVNGKKELTEAFSFVPFETGRTSIGVRQNKQSWFKGKIYKIKITPKQLNPDEFMTD